MGAEGSKPTEREESAIREYEWQKSNLPPESLTLALRKRREELLQENLAQRVDLQQEWVALIGALSNVLQTTLETSSQSRFDIRRKRSHSLRTTSSSGRAQSSSNANSSTEASPDFLKELHKAANSSGGVDAGMVGRIKELEEELAKAYNKLALQATQIDQLEAAAAEAEAQRAAEAAAAEKAEAAAVAAAIKAEMEAAEVEAEAAANTFLAEQATKARAAAVESEAAADVLLAEAAADAAAAVGEAEAAARAKVDLLEAANDASLQIDADMATKKDIVAQNISDKIQGLQSIASNVIGRESQESDNIENLIQRAKENDPTLASFRIGNAQTIKRMERKPRHDKFVEIVGALAENTFITDVVLSNCGGDDFLAEELADILVEDNRTIKELNLESNDIGSAGFVALADMLKENRTLTRLRLANQIKKVPVIAQHAMAEAVQGNPNIITCSVACHDATAREKMDKAIRKNTDLVREKRRSLTLSTNFDDNVDSKDTDADSGGDNDDDEALLEAAEADISTLSAADLDALLGEEAAADHALQADEGADASKAEVAALAAAAKVEAEVEAKALAEAEAAEVAGAAKAKAEAAAAATAAAAKAEAAELAAAAKAGVEAEELVVLSHDDYMYEVFEDWQADHPDEDFETSESWARDKALAEEEYAAMIKSPTSEKEYAAISQTKATPAQAPEEQAVKILAGSSSASRIAMWSQKIAEDEENAKSPPPVSKEPPSTDSGRAKSIAAMWTQKIAEDEETVPPVTTFSKRSAIDASTAPKPEKLISLAPQATAPQQSLEDYMFDAFEDWVEEHPGEDHETSESWAREKTLAEEEYAALSPKKAPPPSKTMQMPEPLPEPTPSTPSLAAATPSFDDYMFDAFEDWVEEHPGEDHETSESWAREKALAEEEYAAMIKSPTSGGVAPVYFETLSADELAAAGAKVEPVKADDAVALTLSPPAEPTGRGMSNLERLRSLKKKKSPANAKSTTAPQAVPVAEVVAASGASDDDDGRPIKILSGSSSASRIAMWSTKIAEDEENAKSPPPGSKGVSRSGRGSLKNRMSMFEN
eukprot:gene4718-3963_t